MKFYKTFARNLLIITVVLAIASAISFYYLPDKYQTRAWPYMLLFFFLTNLLLVRMFIQTQKKKKQSSHSNFLMLATFLKLVVYLAIIIVYLIFFKHEVFAFLLSFFVYYLVYTFVEVRATLKIQKEANQQQFQTKSEKTDP